MRWCRSKDSRRTYVPAAGSFELCVLFPGLFQDGYVRVGIFPESQEILIGGAGFGRLALQCQGAPEPQARERAGADTADKIMHASVRIGDTTVLMSDGRCLGRSTFQGFALSRTVANDDEATRTFGALADGGQVQMALTKTFFSSRFGMVADRFGVQWIVYVAP